MDMFYRLRDITFYWSKVSVFVVSTHSIVSFEALIGGSHGCDLGYESWYKKSSPWATDSY